MSDLIEVSDPAPGVRILRLNRPERMNALSYELTRELTAELARVNTDPDCRIVVLAGAGGAFCAGLDLKGFGDDHLVEEQGFLRRTWTRQREFSDLTLAIHELRQIVIAAVDGPAAGAGMALACASDIRVATGRSIFVPAFLQAGYSVCDVGISWLLPRIVGTGRAHEMMLTARRVEADEALSIGLVTSIVDDAVAGALALAETIKRFPPLSVELSKQGMWAGVETPTLRSAIELENRQQVITAMTEDQPEATAAFLEKRPPNYRNR